MTKIGFAIASILFCSCLSPTRALGQSAPPAINYQGRLTQATGVVVPDGLTGLRVRIFATSSGGSALWDSGDLSVATKSGTFSILLGSGGMPEMSPAVFALGSVYIEVQPTGQAPLLPRQPIASVPWSLYAQTVSNGSITTEKIFNNAITSLKIADGAVTTPKLASSSVDSTKLATDPDALSKLTGGYLTQTATPRLAINGAISLLTLQGTSEIGVEWNRSQTGNRWLLGQRSDVGGANNDLKLLRYVNGAFSGIPLQIQNTTGNIGIGTASPTMPLDVAGSSQTGIRYMRNAPDARIQIGDPTRTWGLSAGWQTSGDFTILEEGVASRLYIQKATGNVGLGVTAPGARLDVNGNINSNGALNSVGIISGWAEMSGFIDFHQGSGSADYDVRLVNDFAGRLSLYKTSGAAFAQLWADVWDQSSKRWKSQVEPLSNALALLRRLQGVRYRWDPEHGGKRDIGFLAEDVGKVIPEIVEYEANGVDAAGMRYQKLTALLVEAVKEQDSTIQKLRSSNSQLAAENARIRAQLASLEARLDRLERLSAPANR